MSLSDEGTCVWQGRREEDELREANYVEGQLAAHQVHTPHTRDVLTGEQRAAREWGFAEKSVGGAADAKAHVAHVAPQAQPVASRAPGPKVSAVLTKTAGIGRGKVSVHQVHSADTGGVGWIKEALDPWHLIYA